MVQINYIQITHDELPVQRIYDIDGVNYIFNFDYNSVGDFYTMTIVDQDDTPVYAAKLVYLNNAVQAAVPGLTLARAVIPLNLSDVLRDTPAIKRIGSDNFDIMRLCII